MLDDRYFKSGMFYAPVRCGHNSPKRNDRAQALSIIYMLSLHFLNVENQVWHFTALCEEGMIE